MTIETVLGDRQKGSEEVGTCPEFIREVWLIVICWMRDVNEENLVKGLRSLSWLSGTIN